MSLCQFRTFQRCQFSPCCKLNDKKLARVTPVTISYWNSLICSCHSQLSCTPLAQYQRFSPDKLMMIDSKCLLGCDQTITYLFKVYRNDGTNTNISWTDISSSASAQLTGKRFILLQSVFGQIYFSFFEKIRNNINFFDHFQFVVHFQSKFSS